MASNIGDEFLVFLLASGARLCVAMKGVDVWQRAENIIGLAHLDLVGKT